MPVKIAGLFSVGLLVHVIEFKFGPTGGVIRALAWAIAAPMLILYALYITPQNLTGRLKAESGSASAESSRSRDGVFEIASIAYVGAYLAVLHRLRPGTWDRILDVFLQLSLVELYWLVAPILAFWWYRQRLKGHESRPEPPDLR